MAKRSSRSTKAKPAPGPPAPEPEAPTLRDRVELGLFLAVEVLCLLLFIDFLFVGFYVK